MRDYQAFADYLSDGIMEINRRGEIVYCNNKAADLDGIAIDEIIGHHLLTVYPSLEQSNSTLLSVLRTGQAIYNFTQTFTNYRGEQITTVNTTLPLYSEREITGAIELSRDITSVKLMSEKLADLHSKIYQNRNRQISLPPRQTNYQLADIITQNATMISLKSKAFKAAVLDLPVLICGATGTGKELFVQAIHHASDRHAQPFIAQNCAALPANLLESILFGTVEGAFTGAANRKGLLETANGGTVFLDEINSTPVALQAKLLRFLSDGKLRALGSSEQRQVNVRVIAALNVLPEEAIAAGTLRSDLYYRLNTIVLELPALRDRPDDIALLTKYFITKYNKKLNKKVRAVSREVSELFASYPWPGNVRELEHVIEGAISMLEGDVISRAELPGKLLRAVHKDDRARQQLSLKAALAQHEVALIEQALLVSGGNISEAATRLNIPRQTLQYRLKKYRPAQN